MANRALRLALRALDRCVASIERAALFLVIAVSLLLFLQWPLRELLHAFSREANDIAQILFALYVAVAVTAATRAGAHLAADNLARSYPVSVRKWLSRAACLAILAPWALFVIASGWESTWLSIGELERFQETLDPGYFLIRVAAIVLALLVLAQAIIDLWPTSGEPPADEGQTAAPRVAGR